MTTHVILGLDFGGTKIAAAVADLDGKRLADATTRTDPSQGARWNLGAGIGLARELLGAAGSDAHLAAIGACTFGIPTNERVFLAPAIPQWGEVALHRELEAAFQCGTIRVGTDVKVAAAAEASSGSLAGADPAIYVNLGTGLAVAVICDGKVVMGANGAAGEIGYFLRDVEDLAAGPEERVRLEDVVSGMALNTAARDTGLSSWGTQALAGEPPDGALAAAHEAFLTELCFHVVNLAIALNPMRIAVGGGITRSWNRIGFRLRQALDRFTPFPPELVTGAYPYDAPLVGAIAMAVELVNGASSLVKGSGGDAPPSVATGLK